MDRIDRIFRSKHRNMSVEYITRGIKTYSLQWSDDLGHRKFMELTWEELEILSALVKIAELHHDFKLIQNPTVETTESL